MPNPSRRPGSRRGPWYGKFQEKLSFERGARAVYPDLRTSIARMGGYWAELEVDLTGYGSRHLRISFDRDHVTGPMVTVDGPTDSPHRYADGSLCMWYPPDPDDKRWIVSDGLLPLIGYAALHLFREEWWRETGHWLGNEAPHRVPAPKPLHKEGDHDADRNG